MDNPKLLYLDIETSPIIGFFWHLGKYNLGIQDIHKETQVICIGYAWDDEPPKCLIFDQNKYNFMKRDDDADRAILHQVSKLIAKADLIIGHNGKEFDISRLRSRLVKYRLPDFAPFLIDDTYLGTKTIGFTSHKLEYLGTYLGVGNKEEHDFGLWKGVVYKNKKSLENMVRYCVKDVVNLRKAYKILKPYMKSSLNFAIWEGNSQVCPHCGEKELIKRGHYLTRMGKYTKYQCKKCGQYSHDGANGIIKPSKYPR